jgi:hypothetical protein
MKQIEATKERPFYSVCYQYTRNPWTLFSFTQWFEVVGDKGKRTMQGVDDLKLAKKAADHLVAQPEIEFAFVYISTDCYNHNEVYKASRNHENTPN